MCVCVRACVCLVRVHAPMCVCMCVCVMLVSFNSLSQILAMPRPLLNNQTQQMTERQW